MDEIKLPLISDCVPWLCTSTPLKVGPNTYVNYLYQTFKGVHTVDFNLLWGEPSLIRLKEMTWKITI